MRSLVDASRGLILSAPASGSGKTLITLGILRALSRRGIPVRAAKSGPDYIDPQFHAAATGQTCVNLDAWAMSPSRIRSLAAGSGPLLIEGAMGLFDGAPPDGKGATAELARLLNVPVVLIIDAASMAHSIAPLVEGFARHDTSVRIAGVILNRVGSPRHLEMLKSALCKLNLPVLGAVMRQAALARPSRHLGLVQAGEVPDLEEFLETAADVVENDVDINALLSLAQPLPVSSDGLAAANDLSNTRIAIARDIAFAFAYPHQISGWQLQGAQVSYFSPLADNPVPHADLVFLPGGYPELYAARIASAHTFMESLRNASERSDIYGECGGYMVLGETLTDADGMVHTMAGLLSLDTSFQTPKLHLGYRNLQSVAGHFAGSFKGHEFHYATTLRAEGTPLFTASDATGAALAPMGLVRGRVSGSFAHVIDAA